MYRLESLASIRPDERRLVLGAAATLFGFMTGHALLETARDALFLARFSARQLPQVYLTIAIVAFGLAQLEERFPRVFRRSELAGWLLLASAVTAAFGLLLGRAGSWIYYSLYVWSGALSTLVVVRFWTVFGAAVTVTQAKRLFPLIGSGSVLGAIAGSALARLLAEIADAREMVLAAGVAFLVTASVTGLLGPAFAPRRAPGAASGRDLSQVLQLTWRRPYLRRVAGLILLATVTFTLVDYLFKSAVDRNVPAGQMEELFATVYLCLNVGSVLVQLVLVPLVLRRWGPCIAHACVPGVLLGGAGALAALGGLLPAVLLKGADGGLRHSLHRTTAELLFVPVTGELRGRVKAFVDVLGQRGGQALASLLIIALIELSVRDRVLAGVTVVVGSVWLRLALGLRRHYLDVFRESLTKEVTETRVAFPALDAASLQTLAATLNDPDDRRVLAAMEILAEQNRVGLIPVLILYHPSAEVVVRALELFSSAGRDDHGAMLPRLRAHADRWVRAAALRAAPAVGNDARALRDALGDPSPVVQATAVAGLVSLSGRIDGDLERQLLAVVDGPSTEARLALAQAIRARPAAAFEDALLKLARSKDADVRREAVQAMSARTSETFLPALVALLGEQALRPEVRRILVGHGPSALQALARALGDGSQPESVRRHVPKAIAAFRSEDAAAELTSALTRETDGLLRFNILSALGSLCRDSPGIALDPAALGRALDEALGDSESLMRSRRALSRAGVSRNTAAREALGALLRHKQQHAVERSFRLVNLLQPDDDLLRAYRALESEKRDVRSQGRELAAHVMAPDVGDRLLPVVDDLYETGAETIAEELGDRPDDVEVLRELMEGRSDSLAALAAYHAGELGSNRLRPQLVRLRDSASPAVAEVAGQALAALPGTS